MNSQSSDTLTDRSPRELIYPYRMKWSTIIWTLLFFGSCSGALFVMAAENDQGLIINGLVELSPQHASVVILVLSGLGIMFVLLGIVTLVMRLMVHQKIELTDTAIALPRSRWKDNMIRVPYGDIESLSVSQVFGQRFLSIDYGSGTFVISGSMLPKKEDLDVIHRLVSGRM